MNKTQCPHCFTTYVISDEQLRISRGIVRCGTCKERFEATLLDPPKIQTFDPRNVFIEPISEQQDETNAQVAKIIENAEPVDFQLDDFDENQKSALPASISENFLEDLGIEDLGAANNYEFSEEVTGPFKTPNDEDIVETSQIIESFSEINFDSDSESQVVDDSENHYGNDGSLIDEVNQLIEKKIILPTEATDSAHDGVVAPESIEELIERSTNEVTEIPSLSDTNDDSPRDTNKSNIVELPEEEFSLATTKKRPISRWFYTIFLLLLVTCFSAILIYQLWLKQAISWPDDKRLTKVITPLITRLKVPVEENLERFDIVIPERRNLSKLELVSARTAPHPTRSSTILLRVSLINGAKIRQPLPWLELSLNDSEGKLISRRSLSPSDYSYNNRIDETIGARELKKVTIELLKFPEHATGYELRLLSN